MTPRHLLLLSSAAVLTLSLAACGEREERRSDAVPAAAASDVVAEPAGSEAPAANEAASDVAAVTPAETPAVLPPPVDLDLDEVAAAGDTRRRGAEPAPEATAATPPEPQE